jgi:hypothetical protein
MGLKQWYSSQPKEVKAAIITGLLALLGIIVTGAFTLTTTELGKAFTPSTSSATASATFKSPTPSPTASRTPIFTEAPSPTASTCPSKLTLTGPPEDVSFTSGNNKALSITGTSCELGGDTGWLFDYDSDDHYYYDDYPGDLPSVAVPTSHSGVWTYSDDGIGDSGDRNKLYTVTLVLASPSCAKHLLMSPPIDGDYKWKAFPAGCQIVGRRDVYVTYP